MPPKGNSMSTTAIERLISQRVADALLTYEANRKSKIGNGNDNGNGSHDSGDGIRRTLHTARGYTYKEFLNCQPLNFKGAVGLAHWTVGHDAAYEMPWKNLMKMMTKAYCPMSEIKKLEIELWNLMVKGTDVVSYTQQFQELALVCSRMVPEESDKVEIRTNQRASMADQRTLTCFNCGEQGHYPSECPELKNWNCGNQAGSSESRGRVYALEGGETDQDPNSIAYDIDA
uniref:Reverse transcriptase domain-containing protein n=1 Tax=Tanacetum cinerariifolium TaxID=118510 RepID=A0A6L2K4Y2_TANCI|nr:reverse transcriptase domain-containing protein [Tanacetum cinerariifolium]